jgi:hypothetical protein
VTKDCVGNKEAVAAVNVMVAVKRVRKAQIYFAVLMEVVGIVIMKTATRVTKVQLNFALLGAARMMAVKRAHKLQHNFA